MPGGQLTEKFPLLHRLVRHHHSNLQLMKDDIGSLLSSPAPKLGPVEETKSERLASKSSLKNHLAIKMMQ